MLTIAPGSSSGRTLRLKDKGMTRSDGRRGDQLVTAGGVVGKVTKVVDDKELEVEIADGIKVRVVRSFVAEVRVKGEPVKE